MDSKRTKKQMTEKILKLTLHKKRSFPLKTSSVNPQSNPQFHVDLVTFTEEILNEKLHSLCSVMFGWKIHEKES